MAKAIMVQGTASGVGKTILTLALCRIFRQDGHLVAPFKAQNLTSNTCLTENGDEIAVSQWLQALAAEAVPHVDMNPIVLKPPFISQGHKKSADEAIKAYARLCEQYDIIVIEGAGSPVELNLKHGDIVNMNMARQAAAPVLLVSDIDRGGVFAALYGTLGLMDESERAHVKAAVVNRFRGDVSQFADGVRILEDITNLPVVGVIPYIEVNLPEEDDLFESRPAKSATNLENQFDFIADTFRKYLDMRLIYDILNRGMAK